jgi:7-cyano-7-deazaguanine synthase
MKAVLILSGGLDSTVLAYHLENLGYDLSLISFDYGQKHSKELHYAEMCAKNLGFPWHPVDLTSLSSLLPGSALLDRDIEVPEGHFAAENMKSTVVPNRNAIMLSIAWGHAIAIDAEVVSFGAHFGDSYIYPDCRSDFHHKIELAFKSGTEGFGNPSLHIFNPFSILNKTSIVRLGETLKVPFEKTWSCYKGGDFHCGVCGTCVERILAFKEAKIEDPTLYLKKGL